jgi:hypothetical protein
MAGSAWEAGLTGKSRHHHNGVQRRRGRRRHDRARHERCLASRLVTRVIGCGSDAGSGDVGQQGQECHADGNASHQPG